jgi:hypothetical protein
MKYVLIATLLISGSAFAYTSSTVGNHPPKDEALKPEVREPASVTTKEAKPSEKDKSTKVAPEK